MNKIPGLKNGSVNSVLPAGITALLSAVCVLGIFLGAGISAYLNLKADKTAFGEWLAPIHVNMEIDRNFAGKVSIYSESSYKEYYALSLRSSNLNDGIQNVELYAHLDPGTHHGKVYVCVPSDTARETAAAIDNISIFIGNKLCYYSNADIQLFEKKEAAGNTLLFIPNLYYSKSLFVKNWVNYYGDFNIGLKLFCSFLLYPFRFIVSYLFLTALLILHRKRLRTLYVRMTERPALWAAVCLVLVTALGFLLRINGFVRHSAWTDEIYSTVRAGNPTSPFEAVFTDPGNPPLYFMLLRWWFMLFGWSEETGTMLPVLLGTAAIPALYCLVRQNYGFKAALMASFFMAVSGFAVGYSQEMRAYILNMFLIPFASYCFLRFLRKQSTNPAAERTGYGCFGKVFVSGYIPFLTPQRLPRAAGSWVCTLRIQSKWNGNLDSTGKRGFWNIGSLTRSIKPCTPTASKTEPFFPKPSGGKTPRRSAFFAISQSFWNRYSRNRRAPPRQRL
jgi:hypothetical protein